MSLTAGCNGLPGSGGGAPTGGIVAEVTGPSTEGLPQGGKASHIPKASDVTTVRVTVSADDISPSIQQEFAPTAADAEIDDVPAGTARTLTVEGLNAAGSTLFSGEETGIAVVAGEVTDVGTIVLSICSASQTQQAQSLVDEGKAALETLAADKPEITFAEAMDDIVAKFGDALTLCPLNEEAAFYYAVFQLPVFLDGAATTGVLEAVGLEALRTEVDKEQPFTQANDPIIGGTDPYVDLSFALAHDYLFSDLPGALGQSGHLLNGISATFSSTLSLPGEDGQPEPVEFDYTDAKVLEAASAIEQLPFYPFALWNFTGLDAFISDSEQRDETTGEPLPGEDVSDAEAEAYFAGSSAPLSLNQTGVDQLNAAFSSAFSALATAVDNLLNGESDDQSDDLIVLEEQNPEYDSQSEITRFLAGQIVTAANTLRDSFASSTPVDVDVPEAVAVITGFGTCTPKAGEAVDTSPFNQQGFTPNSTAGLVVKDVTASIDDAAGVSPPAQSADQKYYFLFSVDASAGVNLSIFARDTVSKDNYSFGSVSYSTDGTNFTSWDSDFSGIGEEGNFGISISKDMFPAYLPQADPLYLFVGVESYGPSPGAFQLYVWSDAVADVPIFLKGNGRNFEVRVYQATVSISLANVFQVLGGAPDLSDRSSLDLANDSLSMDTSDVKAAIGSVLPDATVTITDATGSTVGATTNIIQDHVDIKLDPVRTDVTSEVTDIPGPFCAYPWLFNTKYEMEGAFEL